VAYLRIKIKEVRRTRNNNWSLATSMFTICRSACAHVPLYDMWTNKITFQSISQSINQWNVLFSSHYFMV